MTDASKMPARIWADLNSPALSRSQDQAGGFDSAMPYYRADIVEAMAGALERARPFALSELKMRLGADHINYPPEHQATPLLAAIDFALATYQESIND